MVKDVEEILDEIEKEEPKLLIQNFEKYVTGEQIDLVQKRHCPFCEEELEKITSRYADFGRAFLSAQEGYYECKKCKFGINWLWVDTQGYFLLTKSEALRKLRVLNDRGEVANTLRLSIKAGERSEKGVIKKEIQEYLMNSYYKRRISEKVIK